MVAHLKPVSILGIGSALADTVVTNDDLSKLVDTNDEWIFSRTGIKERRKLGPRQQNSDLATAAALSALKDAGLTPADIGLIICATCSPDSILPSVACTVAGNLELSTTPSFDLNAACSGFVYACSTAAQFIRTGAQKHVLVIGSEALSRMINYEDRSTCILFGDGAGAVVLGPGNGKREFLDFFLAANGKSRNLITAGVGSAFVPDEKYLADKTHCIKMAGKEVYKFAVNVVTDMLETAMAKHHITRENLGLVIPHQANDRILEAARERLDLSKEQFFSNVMHYGNTSSASIPIALKEAHDHHRMPHGKYVILVAFGAGLTWGSSVWKW